MCGVLRSLTIAAVHWPVQTVSACRNHLSLPLASDDAVAALHYRSLPEGFGIALHLQRVSQPTMSALS